MSTPGYAAYLSMDCHQPRRVALTLLWGEALMLKTSLSTQFEIVDNVAAPESVVKMTSNTFQNEDCVQRTGQQPAISQPTHIYPDDAIYCSSEVGYRKDAGTMWTWLKDTEARLPEDFAHIGDNEQSDAQQVAKQGLSPIGIINTAVLADLRGYPMPSGWRTARSDWRSGIALGPAIAEIGNNPFAPSPLFPTKIETPYDFGYLILGPLVFGFLSWLVRNAREHEVGRLFFLARGAYFLHRTYTALTKVAGAFAMPPASIFSCRGAQRSPQLSPHIQIQVSS